MMSNETGGTKQMVIAFLVGMMFVAPMLFIDYGTPEYKELKKAVHVVKHISALEQLEESSFIVQEDHEAPSHFVDWMFSPTGTAEWQISEDADGLSEEELQAIKRIMPVIPQGVSIYPDRPKFGKGQQVVVKADDFRGMIVAEAYWNPRKKPVFTDEWALPELEE